MWNRLKTTRMRLAAVATLLVASSLSIALGAGTATVVGAVSFYTTGKVPAGQVKSIVVEPMGTVANPITLKVEIIRDGTTICTGTSAAPTKNSSGYTIEYTMVKPMSNCPPLESNDLVRATLSQSNEINISYDNSRR